MDTARCTDASLPLLTRPTAREGIGSMLQGFGFSLGSVFGVLAIQVAGLESMWFLRFRFTSFG